MVGPHTSAHVRAAPRVPAWDGLKSGSAAWDTAAVVDAAQRVGTVMGFIRFVCSQGVMEGPGLLPPCGSAFPLGRRSALHSACRQEGDDLCFFTSGVLMPLVFTFSP